MIMKPLFAAACCAAALTFATAAGAADVTFLAKQSSTEWLAGRLVGTDVMNGKGEIIGKVNDVVVNPVGQTQAVVVGVGGFLGVGSKNVAVPYSAIRIGDIVESRRLVVLDVTKDQLAAAPSYVATDPGTADRLKKKASDWAKIAKDQAISLSKQAADKVQEIREQMSQPSAGTAPAPAPAPTAPAPKP
jgi:sporulation protein YlmC with PRC-barrel domain